MGKDYERWLGAYNSSFKLRGLDGLPKREQRKFEGLVYNAMQGGMPPRFRLTDPEINQRAKGVAETVRKDPSAIISFANTLAEEISPATAPRAFRGKFAEIVRMCFIDGGIDLARVPEYINLIFS